MEIEHVLFDTRNSYEKNLAASRYVIHTYKFLARVNSYEFLVRLSWALVLVVGGTYNRSIGYRSVV